jgi:DNA replication protein DnaC
MSRRASSVICSTAGIAEKQVRSIKYQLTIAKLPLAKDIDNFDVTGTPINEALVRDLASGGFLAEHRSVVLIGGTSIGKSHLAIAIARQTRACRAARANRCVG